jgi:sister-chromatid-cohesion protein PDS5
LRQPLIRTQQPDDARKKINDHHSRPSTFADMARASRRRAASPEPAEEPEAQEEQQQPPQDDEMDVEEDAAQPLQFNEPLTWRAGRPIAVADLLQRLRTLYEELSAMEQLEVEDQAGRDAVTPKAQELGSTQLLGHKDRGVKAWTLACIVQMFRILAPNAPYKAGQLRDIFSLVASTVIPALANPTGSYQQQYAEILSSLANLRSIVLITDLPGSENLILQLFANCFDVLSGNIKGGSVEQVAKTVQYNMTIALSAILQEGGKPPDGVLDILLAQFLRADPVTLEKSGVSAPKSLDDISPAYNVAQSICAQCTGPLSTAIATYYTSVLIDASEAPSKFSKSKGRKRTHDESEDESDDGMMTPPAEQDFRDVEKAHRLLRELWRTSSDVIDGVVPQITSEMKAENVQIRTLAVQTVGDMIAGIGAAGPPPPELLDPATYPSQSVESTPSHQYENALFKPIAPHDFSSKYPECYQEFLRRRVDRSPLIRSAWATAAARIVLTSGGGRGLDADQEASFLSGLSDMLLDSDERVRLAAVQAIGNFSYDAIVQKLGRSGGVSTEKSLLNNLAARIKDPKPNVHTAAIELLARIWGVAAGAITEGSEQARTLLGAIPSHILGAIYINNSHINALIHRVLFESLLPMSYPPIRPSKPSSQRIVDSQNGATEPNLDPDTIRVERILTLMRDLDARAKPVFFKLQHQQPGLAKIMDAYLKTGEASHNEDSEASPKEEKANLAKFVAALANFMPDLQLATEHLQKFSKHHDRRANQLIRFCYAPDSDYRKITKAVKEFTKRLEDAPSPMPSVLETMLPLIRIVSILVFNQSHVTPMGNIARTNEKDLGSTAHELLQEISTQRPEAFKVQAKEYVQTLKKQAPTATSPNDPAAVDILKSCAHFAQRSPDDMPKDRDFYEAMSAFALHGSPPKASKHAITVIAASATKKDMYANDILNKCLETADYGAEHFLSKLAAMSQICLLMTEEVKEREEAVTALVIGKILGKVRTPAEDNDPEWTDDVDDDLASKLWGLKILVNGIRGRAAVATDETKDELKASANPVFKLLNTLIENEGELSKTTVTPTHHRSQMRLAAAVQLLKLCCNRTLDSFFTHADFNRLSRVAQDPLPEVRAGFVRAVKKYLGQDKLQQRFYGLVFMYAFEPKKEVKESTTTWLKARAAMAAKANDTSMVQVFVRFLSLLAHHTDFSPNPEELEDFIEYIVFYLKCVATEANLPLIYHLAQRVKTVQDGIDPSKSDNLYVLSDLAQAIIKRFQEEKGWSLQVYSRKVRIPAGPFASLTDHQTAQDISEKRYLPDELDDDVIADFVRASLKPKKRKAEGSSKPTAKKVKSSAAASLPKKAPIRKLPKPAKTPKKRIEDSIPESERRKSSRVSVSKAKTYAEESGSEDEDQPERWDDDDDDENDGGSKDIPSDTPPSSHPTPAAARAVLQESTRVARVKPQKPAPSAAKKLPTRGSKRNGAAAEVDVMEIPGDSDEELSDVPSDV